MPVRPHETPPADTRRAAGLPTGSPATAAYFSNAPHTADLYSIEFSFVLPKGSSGGSSAEGSGEEGKKGKHADGDGKEADDDDANDDEEDEDADTPAGIPGTDLVFGNDFANPIRDRLPPGFDTAFRIVRWAIDPGLDGDVKADKPYLYGPLLSSINVLRVGDKVEAGSGLESAAGEDDDAALQEGADGSGAAVRERLHIPEQGAKRMKHFLNADRRGEFTFERGRVYRCDFFNPYLDFNGTCAPCLGAEWVGADGRRCRGCRSRAQASWHLAASDAFLGWAAASVSCGRVGRIGVVVSGFVG